ncbi:hypothetical protein MOPEL_005_00400 [Mobilicoccus pelagius NBRC 104925]|uniref:Uncharacterized protein n=1 Tax=Mobilicoccus pelagius NBRC 104925 TaxID=1089455 RepID=H5UN70_9MICO|nr:hypothetical protein MOPEL_005_00400 [Mobilicoccus pelagius NBRC 104925]
MSLPQMTAAQPASRRSESASRPPSTVNNVCRTAAAVLITIPAGIVLFVVQRHLVQGLTADATKG